MKGSTANYCWKYPIEFPEDCSSLFTACTTNTQFELPGEAALSWTFHKDRGYFKGWWEECFKQTLVTLSSQTFRQVWLDPVTLSVRGLKFNLCQETMERDDVRQQTPWEPPLAWLELKSRPLVTAYRGDTFDWVQTNQPAGMDFPWSRLCMGHTHRGVKKNSHKKAFLCNTQTHTYTHTQYLQTAKVSRCQCHSHYSRSRGQGPNLYSADTDTIASQH